MSEQPENTIPAHITIKDTLVRHIDTQCAHCAAQAHIGQYDDPHRTDTVLAQWVDRHRHEGQEPTRRRSRKASGTQ